MSLAERPSHGWHVEIENPVTGHVHRPTVVGQPQRNPKVNALPSIDIPVPRDEKWNDDDFIDAPVRVWSDGEKQPVEALQDIRVLEGETVLHAVGGVDLKDRVTVEYDTEKIHLAAEDLITNHTGYSPNVDVPRSSTETNQTMQSADTTTEFNNVTSLATTDPVSVNTGSTVLEQTCWVFEGETSFGTGTRLDGSMSNGESTYFGGEFGAVGDKSTYSFTPGYEIPAGNVTVGLREKAYDSDGDGDTNNIPGVKVTLNTETLLNTSASWGGSDTWEWWQLDTGYDSGTNLQPGTTYTLTIEETDAGGTSYDEWWIDVVAIYDDRFTYTFDNMNDGSGGYLDGPELYPDAQLVTFANQSSSDAVTGGRVESVWDDTSGSQKIEISNDNGASWPLSATNTDTHEADFSSMGTDIRWRATLSRYGSRTTATPQKGFNGQQIDSYTLKADLSDIPLISDRNYDGSLLSVLKDLADKGNMVFEYHDDGTTPTIEWTEFGGRSSTKEPEVATYEISKRVGEVYEKAAVYGAAQDVLKEGMTANHGVAVSLSQSNLVSASEVVYSGSTVYTRGDDYTIDYRNGTITTLSSGTITDGSSYQVDYRYKLKGTYTADGVTTPNRELVRSIPAITTQRTTDQAARILVQRLKVPVYEGRIVVPNDRVGWSVIEELSIPHVPTGGKALQIREIQNTPEKTVVTLGTRRSIEDIVDDLSQRLSSVSDRV